MADNDVEWSLYSCLDELDRSLYQDEGIDIDKPDWKQGLANPEVNCMYQEDLDMDQHWIKPVEI